MNPWLLVWLLASQTQRAGPPEDESGCIGPLVLVFIVVLILFGLGVLAWVLN